jgi:hypothetical protein
MGEASARSRGDVEPRRSQIKLPPGPPRGTMRPAVKRRLVTLAAAASLLLLCIGTAALWVRSYRAFDSVYWMPTEVPLYYIAWSSEGTLTVGQTTPSMFQPRHRFEYRAQKGPAVRPDYPRRFLGVGWIRMSFQAMGNSHPSLAGRHFMVAEVPMWMPVTAAALFPVAWAERRVLAKRYTVAFACAGCGYDLRATPNRCPECGATPAATAAR